MTKVCVLGAGFSGLAAANVLARHGYGVQVVEQHVQAGGRARRFQAQGFTFDMGPSWYWMPDVMDRYFERFKKRTGDWFQLQRLDPSYRIFFTQSKPWDIPAGIEPCTSFFEQIEAGSGLRLQQFLRRAEEKYRLGMQQLAYRPGLSLWEYTDIRLWRKCVRLAVFSSFRKHVAHYFRDPRLRQLMEFPVLFLGASPQRTPALYSLMNYADMALGTWYPMGGMYKLVQAMLSLAEAEDVDIQYGTKAEAIITEQRKARCLSSNQGDIEADVFLCGADYHHGEQLLRPSARSFRPSYWKKRCMAPSALLYYIGVNKKLQGLQHHNLFFDASFEAHLSDIYERFRWPLRPLFYACVSSVTDPNVAPAGSENLFLLVPVAAGLSDSQQIREQYYQQLLTRLEQHTGTSIRPYVIYKRSYGPRDFTADYHAYRGNAYGLANTLGQTAIGKPVMRSRRVRNLFFCGQLTNPGPGIPSAIISGQIAAKLIQKHYA